MATCNRCGQENLRWSQSKAGKWYLSDPQTISTKTYGKYITIPFGHKCPEIENHGRNESWLFDLQPRSGA
jgi:hypothetical protein